MRECLVSSVHCVDLEGMILLMLTPLLVRDQAQAVVKQIVSRYPYEHLDNGGQSEPCLKTESDEIGQRFVDLLQSKVDIAGAKVSNLNILHSFDT